MVNIISNCINCVSYYNVSFLPIASVVAVDAVGNNEDDVAVSAISLTFDSETTESVSSVAVADRDVSDFVSLLISFNASANML